MFQAVTFSVENEAKIFYNGIEQAVQREIIQKPNRPLGRKFLFSYLLSDRLVQVANLY